MAEFLGLLKSGELWIYLFLGAIALIYLRRSVLAISEYRAAHFGMEREKAQRKLSENASILILLGLLAAGEFTLASFVYPAYPSLQTLPTPTLDMLATQTVTLQADDRIVSANSSQVGTPPATVQSGSAGCQAGLLEFTDPLPGGELRGRVILKGTVKVADFGFYKYEFALQDEDEWTTIAAGNTIQDDSDLGSWDTSTLPPGDYFLRLVVTDHTGQQLPACSIPIRILAPEE